jgi:hypothetical protein
MVIGPTTTSTTTSSSVPPGKLSTTLKDKDGNPWVIETIQGDDEEFLAFVKRHKNRVEIVKSILAGP